MSEPIDNGGPAFAIPGVPYYRDGMPTNPFVGFGWGYPPQKGKSLRDWFAGQAMQAFIIAGVEDCRTHDAKAAHFAYNLADAMIAARKGGQA